MGKREVIKRRKQHYESKNNLTVILIIAAFAVVIVGMVILTQYKPVGDFIVPDREIAQQRDGLTMGNPEAKVQVIEFADFQCPGCANYWDVLEPTIIENYVDTGKVLFTYSPFSFLGSRQAWDESVKTAEAAYCASDQQKFWEYRDLILANHNGENQGVYTAMFCLHMPRNSSLIWILSQSASIRKNMPSGLQTQTPMLNHRELPTPRLSWSMARS
jgi:hypothetical protein